jgi:hypothetical protein
VSTDSADVGFNGARRSNSTINQPSVGPPSFTPQPRHPSRSSLTSEATFPRRADTTVATDLALRPIDVTLDTVPPALPYPSLAQSQRPLPGRVATINSPTLSSRTNLAQSPVGKAGFFASLSRKASTKKGNGPTSPQVVASTKLIKSPTTPAPRVINIPTTPSVPGGPRAVPSRVQRAQTIMLTPSNFSSSQSTRTSHKSTIARRPSLSTLPSSISISASSPGTVSMDLEPDPEFVRQVDKLADLLPHADRDILGAYLRRSGQDVLAIGQYLEDEKNGTIRFD